MKDHENTVLAATITGLVLVLVYLCPWRVQGTGEIEWSPIYQEPITYQETYDPEYGRKGGARFEKEEAEIAYGILALELIAVGAIGGGAYALASRSKEGERSDSNESG